MEQYQDKRIDIIVNKMGLSMEIAEWAIGLHKKYAIWIGNQIKENPKLYPEQCGNFQNILDWKRDNPTINLNDLNFNTALRRAKSFFKKKNVVLFKETPQSLKNKNVVLDLGELKWVQLLTIADAMEEGAVGKGMGHCVGTSHGHNIESGRELAFSLRDKFNKPHLTISITTADNMLREYKGKANSQPKDEYIIPFLKLIANYKVDKIADPYFLASLRKKPEYLALLDKTHSHLITFRERVQNGFGLSNDIIYTEHIHEIIKMAAGEIFRLPENFRVLEDFLINMENPGAIIDVGNNTSFAGSVSLQGHNIIIGDNMRVGGNLEIVGGLENIPKNLRVCGDVKIFLSGEKHKQNDLYNALEGIYLGGYLDIEIIKKIKNKPYGNQSK